MAKIYDLSVTLRPDHLENSELELNRVSHEEAARIFAKQYRIKVSDLPDGSFFSTERIELRSHLGTHIDAPYHFYPTSEGRPAKFIDEGPLDWGMGDGVVLDFRQRNQRHITEYDMARRWKRSTTARNLATLSCSGRVERIATTMTRASPSPRRALTAARSIIFFASA